VRGKTGEYVVMQALLMLMKGLPLAYNDLQEDKEALLMP